MEIKYKVFEYAKKKGYSKTDIMKATGISSRTITKIAKGESVTLDTISRICAFLKCQPGDILTFKEEFNNPIYSRLLEEMQMNLKGGIYHQTQIILAYNSNHIEGSKLTEEQTRYIFETNTIGVEKDMESVNIDDIIETINHFTAFKFVLQNANEELSEDIIKEIHKILKSNTSDSRKEWFKVGDYKTRVNVVGSRETSKPEDVEKDMKILLSSYRDGKSKKEEDLIKFHYDFECIHPFQDGNGRVGRLILFKECLKYNLVPIVILDSFKEYYYRGLKEYKNEVGYLTDTCLHGQDYYEALLKHFRV